ncbi:ArsR/SmtB family transcription factor [Halostreptopolyspora alba]|uniref:ArsR family transcriptional regulator n=1 Tax=Halostreptopolyspora alba TaxID=2487137 RepID=A0A3N0DY74_9ACTN|nr:ArsR family transcriptional regulator [Nocardiopsaceae bacterium YIM 96095]
MSGQDAGNGDVLTALADPTRRELLEALAAHGTASATTLSAELPISRQAVVKHLGVLDRAGLVRSHREGREVRYTVRTAPLNATARWMDDLAQRWDRRLEAIRNLAEREGPGGNGEH